ncbi:MAG: hypothetical protein GY757_58120, partial [bacterium]|nr:hypothetical protein [bacterium]
MKHLQRSLWWFLFLFVLLTTFTKATNTLKVTCNLKDKIVHHKNVRLKLRFSHLMRIGSKKPDPNSIARISPVIDGTFSWRGRDTLVFEPQTSFRSSTRYRVTIPAGTTAAKGAKTTRSYSFSFSTPPPSLNTLKASSWPKKNCPHFSPLCPVICPVGTGDSLVISFDQDISLNRLKRYLKVLDQKNNRSLPLSLVWRSNREVKIVFKKALETESIYTLRIDKGFTGIDGNVFSKKSDLIFRTIPAFRYLRPEKYVYRDEAGFKLVFSAPVNEGMEKFVKVHLNTSTGMEKIPPGKYKIDILEERRIRRGMVHVKFRRKIRNIEDYVVTFDKSFKDSNGNSLQGKGQVRVKLYPQAPQPYITFSSDKAPPQFGSYNIKKIDFTVVTFKAPPVKTLEKWNFPDIDKNHWKTYGAMARSFSFKNLVDKTYHKTYTFDTFDEESIDERKFNIDLKELTGKDSGFFGIMPGAFEPGISNGDPEFYEFQAERFPKLILIHKKKMEFLLRNDGRKNIVWGYNPETFESVGDMGVYLWRDGEKIRLPAEKKKGHYIFNQTLKNEDTLTTAGPGRDCDAYYKVDAVDTRFSQRSYLQGKLFTEKGFYLPGDTVCVAGIVKNNDGSDFITAVETMKKSGFGKAVAGKASARIVQLNVSDPRGNVIHRIAVNPDKWGGFKSSFKIGDTDKKGIYTIYALYNGLDFKTTFKVDYFQANTFEVKLENLAPRYLQGQALKPQVRARYLSGNPMGGAPVDVRILTRPLIRGIKNLTAKSLPDYSFSLDTAFRKGTLDKIKRTTLDKKGTLSLNKYFKKITKLNFPTIITIDAIAESKEGKEFKTSGATVYCPGNKVVGIKIPLSNETSKEIPLDLAVLDSTGDWSQGKVNVTVFKRSASPAFTIIKEWKGKLIKAREHMTFNLPESGDYLVKCDIRDKKGRELSTSHNFHVFLPKKNPSGSTAREFRMRTGQATYNTGDTIKLELFSKFTGKAFVTIEQYGILEAFTVPLKKGKTVLRDIFLEKTYFPGIKIRVTALFKNGKRIDKDIDLTVRSREKQLSVTLSPEKSRLKPSSKSKIRLDVKDAAGKGAKANLFLYCVDEGNLSLTDYTTPDMHTHFYYRNTLWKDKKNTFSRTHLARHKKDLWYFERPDFDIKAEGSAFFGRLVKIDGSPIAGARLTRYDIRNTIVDRTVTSPNGYYRFDPHSKRGPRPVALKLQAAGYVTYTVTRATFTTLRETEINFVLHPLKKGEKYRASTIYRSQLDSLNYPWEKSDFYTDDLFGSEGVEGGIESGVEGGVIGGVIGGVLGSAGSGEPVLTPGEIFNRHTLNERNRRRQGYRLNMEPVLFFKRIETDENGFAEVEFEASGMLSRYRVMAVAYNARGFGNNETHIEVSADLSLQETMPEFAVAGDNFTAGVLVSNLTGNKLPVHLKTEFRGIGIRDKKERDITIKSRRNEAVNFSFTAPLPGRAHIGFHASSGSLTDGIVKALPVLDDVVDDSQLSFDTGERINKTITIEKGYVDPVLKITLSSSLLDISKRVTGIVLTYPYGCMEQRTTKVLPFLALGDTFREKFKINKTPEEVKKAVEFYLEEAPKFQAADGGMAYYTGRKSDEYLTVYALWAFQMAIEKDYDVDPAMIDKMICYLEGRNLSDNRKCFLQYVYGTVKKADPVELKRLYSNRESLSIMGKVFLYKALHRQLKDKEKTTNLLREFEKLIKVTDKGTAIVEVNYPYSRELPFRGSRYINAILLQAILEVEGGFKLAAPMMKNLLGGPSYSWRTTQSNFWILYAMSQYMETECVSAAKIRIGTVTVNKEFNETSQPFTYERVVDAGTRSIEIEIE